LNTTDQKVPVPFSLATLRFRAVQVPAIGIGDRYWPLAAARAAGVVRLDTDIKGLLVDWPAVLPSLRQFADACASGGVAADVAIPAAQAELALPLQFPNKLVAVGANYYDHLAEMGASIPKAPHPVMFIKPPTTCLVGPGKVLLPDGCTQFDWEIELAVVIGQRLRKANRAQAMDAVAGYSVAVDFTARDYFYREDFYFKYDFLLGKGQDATNPLGPVIVPAEFVGDPHDLRLTLSVNGQSKQDASTSGMIYRIDEQLSSISQFVTLEPGDVVLTGSPAGVGLPRGEFLKPGDVVVATAEKIGPLRVEIARE
jgi:2-keto-4-pentenoate hydratase/2-oxohepta-3-ene-1,7-dioic acid hydratase in catechol pathway